MALGLRCVLLAGVVVTNPGLLGGQTAEPTERPKPFAAFSASALSLRDSIVSRARAQSGTRYRFGGETPGKGFDCSGLIRYVASSLGIALPRTANQQATEGVEVPKDIAQLKPGDLLTFGSRKRVSHIGIYVGEGKFVHASTKAGRVIESSLTRTSSPLVRSWRGARRLVASADSGGCGGPDCVEGVPR